MIKSYSLDSVLSEATRKGFTDSELVGVTEIYYKARSRFEDRQGCAHPGYKGAVEYIDRCDRICYAAAVLYIDRIIDKWQGDEQ